MIYTILQLTKRFSVIFESFFSKNRILPCLVCFIIDKGPDMFTAVMFLDSPFEIACVTYVDFVV